MAKYRKKLTRNIYKAIQRFKNGDHPNVDSILTYGKDIFGHCGCSNSKDSHGIIQEENNNYVVCPGNWIVTEDNGKHFPCELDIFEDMYEKLEE